MLSTSIEVDTGLILARRWYVKIRFAGRLFSVIGQNQVDAKTSLRERAVAFADSVKAAFSAPALATVAV